MTKAYIGQHYDNLLKKSAALNVLLWSMHFLPPCSYLSLALPGEARGSSCRFRAWQPQHSGPGRDMWALDDLTVTGRTIDNIELNFDEAREANESLRYGSLV